ncbi:S-layer homology domain-containing protein [Paenibacillus sp.]|uniref:S-layer homology domain-containing protein n=1 Tax=Paenibacillus sp. TaxID=58172 RepID=UPI002811E6FB|nr:S-layer homology domain-containing protein [Paenibacillus sp.]
MKFHWTAKLSGATALLLAVSMALPLLAFAQSYIYKVSYNKSTGTVTASVYTDETVTGNVYLDIMDEHSSVIDSVYLGERSGTYTVGDSVYDRYDFTYTVTANVYDRLKLASWYKDAEDTVTSDVYDVESIAVTPPPGNGGSGGWGGGYVPTSPPTIDGAILAQADGTVAADELKEKLAEQDVVRIVLTSEIVLLPASVLAEAPNMKKKTLMLEKDGITLELPLSVLNLERLAEQLNTKLEALVIKAEIAPLEGEALEAVEQAASRIGAELRSDAVSFELTAIGEEDRTASIHDFGGVYVSRTLPVDATAHPSLLTGATFDSANGTFSFAPMQLAYGEASGDVEAAVLKRPSNSVYAVIERSKSFADIGDHWAQADIEKMAGKLIVEGVTAQAFEPERSITRAEFAALLVRALGLPAKEQSAADFTDVSSSDWFADVVATAAEAELVNGYPDGAFRPNDTVTRAEMAAMLVRATAFATGTTPQMTIAPGQIEAALSGFADRHLLAWEKTYMAIVVKSGIVEGMAETTLAPNGLATRAQAAVMLKRWLTSVGFSS